MVQLVQLLTGPLNFLQRDPEEIRRLVPDADRSLPPVQRMYLEDESSTPILGFPVLATPELQALERAFELYVVQEEEVELAIVQREGFDSQAFQGAWEGYRLQLMRAAENVTTAIYRVGPWGVDVSTGVEKQTGRKDPVKMKAFIEAARSAAPTPYRGPDQLPYDWADE